MQPVRFDRHARKRMKEREVSDDEVLHVIEYPDLDEPSIKGRFDSYKLIGGRHVRVTYKKESDYMLVITVTVRKKSFKEPNDENRI